jgi:hypothetical protein
MNGGTSTSLVMHLAKNHQYIIAIPRSRVYHNKLVACPSDPGPESNQRLTCNLKRFALLSVAHPELNPHPDPSNKSKSNPPRPSPKEHR